MADDASRARPGPLTAAPGYYGAAYSIAVGYASMAVAPDYRGAAIAFGDCSSASCGDGGLAACFGEQGRVRGGNGAVLCAAYLDENGQRRVKAARVGDDGILPDTWYQVTEAGEFVAAPKKEESKNVETC